MSFVLSRIGFNLGIGRAICLGMERAVLRDRSSLCFSIGAPTGNSSRPLFGRASKGLPLHGIGFKTLLSAATVFSASSKSPLDMLNNDGDTALLLAVKIHARQSRYEICEILLKGGADPNILDGNNETALDIAERNGNQDMINLLKSYGARHSKS